MRSSAPAYSELVDPVEQRRRLTAQSLLAAGGDPEAMELDEEFLSALEYAMPPTGGLGMGVDRLVMTLTGSQHPGDDPVPTRETAVSPMSERPPAMRIASVPPAETHSATLDLSRWFDLGPPA